MGFVIEGSGTDRSGDNGHVEGDATSRAVIDIDSHPRQLNKLDCDNLFNLSDAISSFICFLLKLGERSARKKSKHIRPRYAKAVKKVFV